MSKISTSKTLTSILCFLLSLAFAFNSASAEIKLGDDTVLRGMEKSVIHLSQGDISEAKKILSRITKDISAIWANNEAAAKARSVWHAESVKPFKGEPYERTMAFYYLGLIYLMENDYGNAQAVFKTAILQDAFAEEAQKRMDATLPVFLRGWALQAQGSSSANKEYEFVKQLRPDFTPPPLKKQPNTLIIVETGRAPRKIDAGFNEYKIAYRKSKKFNEQFVQARIDGDTLMDLFLVGDVFFQASTRGGRVVDGIIAGKVQFKKSAGKVADTAADLESTFSHGSYAGGTAGVAMKGAKAIASLVKLGAKAVERNVETVPDFRAWRNLPDRVHVGFLDLPPGTHKINFIFLDSRKNKLETPAPIQKTVTVEKSEKPQVIWVTARNRQIRI